MAGKLVKRTLDIIKSGVDTKVKDYTSNWTSFRNDAREVKDILIKGETNAADTVQKLKRTGITKKISEWFYGTETEFDSSGADSDFDPGFSVESSSDSKLDSEKSSTALTYDSMKDLSAKQTGMMVKIGRRQTEQSVANTAEVISTINNRTAEMVAVMNNINTSLKGVNDRLDKLIKLQTLGIEAEEERVEGGDGLYDSNGMLSLKGIFNAAKNSTGGYFGGASGALSMLKGGIKPEDLFGLALDHALGRPMSALGGSSVNELGKKFNETIGNAIQTALTGVIESKTFTKLFGNIGTFGPGRDYGELRANHYDTKRAQFDGMTRHSIVKIMPELLIKLNENISGKSYHINQNGDIVEGPAKNYFNEAISGAIGGHGINSRAMSAVRGGMNQVFKKDIPQEDIDKAADALVHYFILQMESSDGRMLTKADIRKYEVDATKQACEMLGMVNTDSAKDYDYWSRVCQTILYKVANSNSMDANAFVSNVNQSLRNMQKAAADTANGFYGSQAGKITTSVIQSSFVSKYGNEQQQQQISRVTTTTASKFTTADYVKGIFAILNRGVSVKLEGKGRYDPITEADIRKEPWQITVKNDESAQMLVNALTGNKGGIQNSMESALGLLGGANSATGGRIGALNTVANLTTTFNQGRQFLDRIKGNQFAQNLNAAIHGDASGLQAQFNGAMGRVGNALPYGLTHDQRMIDMANSARGIGSNMLHHGSNFANSARERIMDTRIGQAGYRHANNIVYGIDDMRLKAAQNSINNFSTAGLSEYDRRRLEIAANAFNAGDMDKYNRAMGSSNSIGGMSDADVRDYISGKYGTIDAINKRRSTSVNGKPDIGAVRMAAPEKGTKEHGKMYNLVQSGFNMTAKILGSIAKIVRSGLEDVYYGFGSAIQGMFGGLRRNQQTGKMEMHRGLIGDLTWGTMKTGAHYTKMALGAAGKLVGKVGGAIGTATQGIRDKWNAGDTGIYDSELDRNLTRAELNERRRDEIVSRNYEHRDKDGKWHFRAQRDENGNKVAKQGSTVTRGDFADAPLKALGKTVMNCVGKLGAFGKGLVEVTKKLGGMIAKPFKFAANIFKKSSFGKGFFEGFDKAKEVRNARKLEKERNSSFSNSAIGKIMDEITGKTKEGPLQAICDILKVIETNTNPNKPTTDPNATGEGTNTNETQSGSTSGGNVDTKGENKENKEKKDDSSDKGEGESGGEEKKKGRWASFKESASEKVGGAVNKFKGTEAGKLVTGTLENMGKVVGGMAQGVMGILKIAAGVLTAMEGFKAIQQLVEDIFKKGLKPLNQIFQKAYHMLKPLAVQITNIVKDIAKALVQMLDGVMKVLTPLLKMVSDAISTIFDTILKPVMEILDATLSACMVPITLVLDAMKPVLDIMCADLKVVSGVVQMGLGGVMGLLGFIGKGIGGLVSLGGKILKAIPGGLGRSAGKNAVKLGSQITEAADDMLGNSKALMVNGAKQFKEGLEDSIAVAKKIVTLEYLDNPEEEKKETIVDEERKKKFESADLANNFAAGDVNTYNTWNYTYGSGNTMNQHTYGSTMNMSERGCGPVALADAYMRRTGSGMNPLTLAGAMMGNGNYEPNRGTSVASMLNTGNALGMNMQVGGVTQRSLNGASPSNPITVMGSGSGFGTKRGNDHYLNVVGSDGRGNSYVSNPLTGRVSKTPTSQLALNSRLGLYGSGDKLPDEFGIDLDSMTALERLQSLSDRFTKIFTGDSTVDKVNKQIDEGKAKNRNDLLDNSLSGLTEEELKTIEDSAMTYAKERNPKRDGESDEDWEARCKKSNDYQMGLAAAKQDISVGRKEEDLNASTEASEGLKSGWDSMDTKMKAIKESLGKDDVEEEGSSGSGTFLADNGVALYNYGKPIYEDINIHDWMNESNHQSGHSPLHDFFGQTNDDIAWSYDGNWYEERSTPDNVGRGSVRTESGPHGGVDINWNGTSEGMEARATTGGVVDRVATGAKPRDGSNDGMGNAVIWKDSGGMYHWYMHLRDDPLVSGGQTIEAGQLLGYVGNTGASDGAHLHYSISDNKLSSKGINPITYFKNYNPAAAGMYGDTTIEHLWSYMRTNGYTPEAIAGFLGFIYGESGATGDLDPKTLFNQGASSDLDAIGAKMREGNKEYVSNASDYTTMAYRLYDGRTMSAGNVFQGSDGVFYPDTGIAQWVGKNTEGLLAMGKQENIPWTNEGLQVRYFSDVYANSIKDRLNNAKSLEDAFEIAMYKNAGDPEDYPGGSAGFRANRLPYAKKIYEKYKNADITQWTGYAEQHARSTIDSSKNTNNTVSFDGKMYDPSSAKTRKNLYIAYYRELNHIRTTMTQEQLFGAFSQKLSQLPKEYVTADAEELLTDEVVREFVIKAYQTERNKVISPIKDGRSRDAADEAFMANKMKYCRSTMGSNPYMWAAVNSPSWLIDATVFFDPDEGSESTEIDSGTGMSGIVSTQDSELNIRSEPNTSSDIIGTLPKGTRITVVSTNDANWFAYDHNGKEGYVSSNYITLDKTGSNYQKFTTSYLTNEVGGEDVTVRSAVNNYRSNNTDTNGGINNPGGVIDYSSDPTRTKSITVSARNIREWFTPSSLDESAVSDIGTNWSQMYNMYDNERISEQDLNYDGWIGFPNTMNKFAKALKGINYDDPSSKYYGTADDTGMTWSAEPSIIKSEQGPLRWQLLNYIDNMNDNTLSSINIKPDVGQMDYNTKTYKPKRVKLGDLGNNGLIPNISGLKNLKDAEIIDWVSGSGDVPTLDMNQIFDDASQTMQNAAGAFGGNSVTNVIVRDDQATTDMLTKLSEMTFKVRNERVEELLEELVTYVKTKKKPSTSMVRGTNNYTTEDMFDDDIPEAVVRLSKG